MMGEEINVPALLATLADVANIPGDGSPAVPVDVRISAALDLLSGVPNYLAVAESKTAMRNESLRLALAGLQALVASQGTLLGTLAARLEGSDAKLVVQAAQLQLAQATYQQLLAGQQADEARLALVEAKATLTASATETNRLDIVALKAADSLLQARAGTNEVATAAAQATATQARTEAATAQAKADADATAALQAKAAAEAAQATANSATAALAVLSGRLKLVRVAIPAIGIGQVGTVTATWPAAFADDNYHVLAQVEGAALLGLAPDVTARTVGTATAQLRNSLGLALTAGQGFLAFTAIHA